MVKKNVLGRGLAALIEDAKTSTKENWEREYTGSIEIPIEAIETNPYQPRESFNDQSIQALAQSLETNGLIQPVTVRISGENKYQLISGERRLRASKLIGLKSIPAYIRSANDTDLLTLGLIENIQREDLNAIEIAISFNRLIEECSLTQEELSSRVGKDRSTISNYLRLMKLPEEIQIGIKTNKISMGHARSLLSIDNQNIQIKTYYKIINENLSVREVENYIKSLSEGKTPKDQQKAKTHSVSAGKYENQLSEKLGTKVSCKQDLSGKGKIVIHFDSNDSLERIISAISR